MWPLLLCSVLMVAIMIERGLRLQRKRIFPTLLIQQIKQSKTARVELNAQACQDSALGRVLQAGHLHQDMGADYARAQMEVAASKEIESLEKNINMLGTISAVAPLLGLLGTVVGIIEAFLVVDGSQLGDASSMIPGISKALITTAVGMLIAIPALMAYRHFQRLVLEYVNELERQATLYHANLYVNKTENIQKVHQHVLKTAYVPAEDGV